MDKQLCYMMNQAQFQHFWPIMSQELEKVRHTWEIWWTKEALVESVTNGGTQVWAIGSPDTVYLVAFTQIIYYPANVILRVNLILGTKIEEYYDLAEATIEKFAMDRGCAYLETCARPAFKRRIKGAQYHGVQLTRKLANLKVQ